MGTGIGMTYRDAIGVECGDDGLGLYWFGDTQLRQSLAFIAALVRRLEGLPDDVWIGLKEERLSLANVVIRDLSTLREGELDLFRQRWVQEAMLLIDGEPSAYVVRCEGSSRGLVALDIPPERREPFAREIADFLKNYAAAHGVPFNCPWLE